MNTTSFIGEFDCKLDAKGRLTIPSGLFKQVPAAQKERFVVNRGIFQKCLILYPIAAWDTIMNDLSKLNRFSKENDTFIRQFTNGAIEVEVDNVNRILLPKRLTEFAGIEKDVVLSSSLNKIEIWSDKNFKTEMDNFNQQTFEALAEKVMSKKDEN
jgi:MraZ protein